MSANNSDLFIVDNSISGWTGLRYLEEWTEISTRFDIATEFFEIGSLLALDGKWQQLDKIRILMGNETTFRTRRELGKALKERTQEVLDRSLEEAKKPNPFLEGVEAIAEALRSGKIECRIYTKDKFHAKAYITHGRQAVVGARALVGSSNFTEPGLSRNIELNVQIQTGADVALLQEWYEEHWEDAEDISELALDVIDRQIRAYSPFEVYAKSLQELFRGHSLTGNEWDQTDSKMFPYLDQYQKEAYWAMVDIARRNNGAFLCDGWGKKAAARVYHICRSGRDIEFPSPFTGGPATRKPVKPVEEVPGAPIPARSLYDASQALSWVASRRNNPEERTAWQIQIPSLVEDLAAKKD